MPKFRPLTGFAGVGAWMLAVGIGLVPNEWPNFLRPHPGWVIAFIVLGAVLFFFPWLQMPFRVESTLSPPGTQTNKAGRDITGHQIGHAEHVHIGDTLFGADAIESKRPPAPTVEKEVHELPNLVFGFGNGRVSRQGGSFKWDKNGDRCVTISISNRPATTVGGPSARAESIIAHLVLSYSWTSISIASTYWIGRIENQIDLNPGDKADLLVAAIDNPISLKLFENTVRYPPEALEWNSPIAWKAQEEPEPIPFSWIPNMELIGELFIISKSRLQPNTLGYKKFRIVRGNTESDLTPFRVEWLE